MPFLTLFSRKTTVRKRSYIGGYLNNIWQVGLDLLFPPPLLCSVCGRELPTGALVELCQTCLEHLPLVGESFCQRCGRPLPMQVGSFGNRPSRSRLRSQKPSAKRFLGGGDLGKSPVGEISCFDCARTVHFFVQNRAVGIYSGALKEHIQELKYHYNRQLGVTLGQMMGFVAERRRWIPPGAYLLAVPLHVDRLRQRGYNQAELLLQGMKGFVGAPILGPDTVIRKAATGASSNLGPRERRANLRGVFQVPRPGQIANKVLCVIDDIYTTGATLDELAHTLLQAGAIAVYGLTLSIAIDHQDLLGNAPGD